MKLSTSLVGILTCLALAVPVSAGLLVEETFNYPAGSLHGRNGGIGFTGPWQAQGDYPPGYPDAASMQQFDVLDGAVEYAGYSALGNSVLTTTRTSGSLQAEDLHYGDRPITPIDVTAQSEFCMGFSYQKLRPYSSDGKSGLLELFDSSDPTKSLRIGHYRGVVSDVIGPDGEPTGATANEVNFFVGLGSERNDPFGLSAPFTWQTSSAIGQNTPLFVLTKFVFTEDYTLGLLKFSMTPEALPTSDPATWDTWISIPEQWNLNLDTLRFRGEGENRKGKISEIRVGTTVGDVVLIPEPATMTLLGIGGLALIRRKR